MFELRAGGLAKSLAGHDKNGLYVVMGVEGEFAIVSDGRRRPVERPKRKNRKHLQVIGCWDEELGKKLEDGEPVRNEEICHYIRSHKQ